MRWMLLPILFIAARVAADQPTRYPLPTQPLGAFARDYLENDAFPLTREMIKSYGPKGIAHPIWERVAPVIFDAPPHPAAERFYG